MLPECHSWVDHLCCFKSEPRTRVMFAVSLAACGSGSKTFEGWTSAQFESASSKEYAQSRGLYSEATIRCGFEIIAEDYTYAAYAADSIPLDVAMQTLLKCG